MYEINCYDSYGNTINYLTQWDYNRQLSMYLDEYNLLYAPEVHFCNQNSEEALVVQSSVEGSKVTVDIPNILLQEHLPLFLYVYLSDAQNASSQKTIISTTIPIRQRPRPADYIYEDNVDIVTWAEIEERIFTRVSERVSEISISVATENTLGGIKAAKKTNNETVEVKIGEDGKLYVPKTDDASYETNIDCPSLMLKDGGKGNKKMAISFTDDDCKEQAYEKLFNKVIKPYNIPYTFACPTGNIGKTGYISLEHLKEMYEFGVKYSCHLTNESNMDSFTTEEALKNELEEYFTVLNSWGINDVNAYAYCQGVVVDDYIKTIKQYFDLGMTVKKGINQIPIESYYAKRVEVFSRTETVDTISIEVTYINDGGESVTETVVVPVDAKSYVDQLIIDGGWLIFMTHAWYDYFNSDQLIGLIKYIKSLNIEILGLNEAIVAFGNLIDSGNFKKPLEDVSVPYFVVDANGEVWSNSVHDTSISDDFEIVQLELQNGYLIDPATGKKAKTSDGAYKVSTITNISGYDALLINGWAYEGWNVYSFLNDANEYLEGKTSTVPYGEGGTRLTRKLVVVPDGATKIIIAGNTYEELPKLTKFTSKRLDTISAVNHTRTPAWYDDYKLSATGGIIQKLDSHSRVSDKMPCSEGELYELTCSNNYGLPLYVILDSNDNIIRQLIDTKKDNNGNTTAEGSSVYNHLVEIPQNALHLRVNTNFNEQPEGYKIIKVEKEVNDSKYDVTLSKKGVAADAKTVGDLIKSLEERIVSLETGSAFEAELLGGAS